MHNLKIDVERLSDEPEEIRTELDEAWFARELEGVVHAEQPGEGRVEFQVERMSGEKIQVTGRIQAKFAAVCGRCLEAAPVSVDEHYYMVFEPQGDVDGLPDEVELTEADLSWEGYQGDEIDLNPQVREQCLLAVPMRPLCREDCPGIAYDTGAPEEPEGEVVDPRWKALAKFKPTS